LPWDVLLLIVEESDQASLGALGSASLALLEATAPRLYETVTITSTEQIEELFCERKKTKVSFLSLSPSPSFGASR